MHAIRRISAVGVKKRSWGIVRIVVPTVAVGSLLESPSSLDDTYVRPCFLSKILVRCGGKMGAFTTRKRYLVSSRRPLCLCINIRHRPTGIRTSSSTDIDRGIHNVIHTIVPHRSIHIYMTLCVLHSHIVAYIHLHSFEYRHRCCNTLAALYFAVLGTC